MSRPDPSSPENDPFFNPYQAPKARPPAVDEGPRPGLYRHGTQLVMGKAVELPDRCVRCNAPAEGYRLKRNLSWHPPGYYAIVLFNILIYALVAMIVRKTAKIRVGLCPEHRAKRARDIAIAWASALLGIGLMIATIIAMGDSDFVGPVGLAGLGLFLFGLIYGTAAVPPVTPARIDDRFVWLKNVSPEFLDGYPDWPGRP